jgi:prolyl-tRNA synthetase
MFHLPAAENKEYGLNSTHEEIVTPLMKEFLVSYKDLPTCVYQIQDKFRNEKRAKS